MEQKSREWHAWVCRKSKRGNRRGGASKGEKELWRGLLRRVQFWERADKIGQQNGGCAGPWRAREGMRGRGTQQAGAAGMARSRCLHAVCGCARVAAALLYAAEAGGGGLGAPVVLAARRVLLGGLVFYHLRQRRAVVHVAPAHLHGHIGRRGDAERVDGEGMWSTVHTRGEWGTHVGTRGWGNRGAGSRARGKSPARAGRRSSSHSSPEQALTVRRMRLALALPPTSPSPLPVRSTPPGRRSSAGCCAWGAAPAAPCRSSAPTTKGELKVRGVLSESPLPCRWWLPPAAAAGAAGPCACGAAAAAAPAAASAGAAAGLMAALGRGGLPAAWGAAAGAAGAAGAAAARAVAGGITGSGELGGATLPLSLFASAGRGSCAMPPGLGMRPRWPALNARL